MNLGKTFKFCKMQNPLPYKEIVDIPKSAFILVSYQDRPRVDILRRDLIEPIVDRAFLIHLMLLYHNVKYHGFYQKLDLSTKAVKIPTTITGALTTSPPLKFAIKMSSSGIY